MLPLKRIKRKKSNPTLVELSFLKKKKEKIKAQVSLTLMKENWTLIIVIMTISMKKRKLSLLKRSNNTKGLLKISKISKAELTITLCILSRIRIKLKIQRLPIESKETIRLILRLIPINWFCPHLTSTVYLSWARTSEANSMLSMKLSIKKLIKQSKSR